MEETLDERLKHLAVLDLANKGEMTVRENLITPLLQLLGYDQDEDYEVIRDGDDGQKFKLLLPTVYKGAKTNTSIAPDYIPTVRKKFFWVLEAKRGSTNDLKTSFIAQVLQYAVHPQIQARFATLIDGVHIAVYNVHSEFFDLERKIYEPILEMAVTELPARFEELRLLLGHEEIRDQLAHELENDYVKLCTISLNQDYPQALLARLQARIPELRIIIRHQKALLVTSDFDHKTQEIQRIFQNYTVPELIASCRFPLGSVMTSPAYELAKRVRTEAASFSNIVDKLQESSSLYQRYQYTSFLGLCIGAEGISTNMVLDYLDPLIRKPLPQINRVEAQWIRVWYKLRILHINPVLRPWVQTELGKLSERERALHTLSVEQLIAPNEYAIILQVYRSLKQMLPDDLNNLESHFTTVEASIDENYQMAKKQLPVEEQGTAGGGLDFTGLYESTIYAALLRDATNIMQTQSLLPTSIQLWLETNPEGPWDWEVS